MALPRQQVADGLLRELDTFEQLIRSLSGEQWNTTSRCSGWTVGDIARHVVGTMADVAAGNTDGLGTPEMTAREVNERAGRSPAEIGDECAEVTKAAAGLLPMFDDAAWAGAAPGGYEGSLGDGVEALWYDAWLHADDIRSSLGLASVPEPGLDGGVSHVTFELAKRGWTGDVPAEAFTFVLEATGRAPGDGTVPNIYAE